MTDIFKSVDDIADLTNDQFMLWYERVLSKEPKRLAVKVTEIINRQQHNPNGTDPEAGAQEYVFS